jgi:hypothetical protein
MTTPTPAPSFAGAAPAERLERAAAALTAHGFTAEVLDDAAAARQRLSELIPEGARVFTGASETLRLSASTPTSTPAGATTRPRPGARAWTGPALRARPGHRPAAPGSHRVLSNATARPRAEARGEGWAAPPARGHLANRGLFRLKIRL